MPKTPPCHTKEIRFRIGKPSGDTREIHTSDISGATKKSIRKTPTSTMPKVLAEKEDYANRPPPIESSVILNLATDKTMLIK